MAVEFNTPISLLAFAAFNKSGSPNSSAQWGNAGDGYLDPSVNWLGYVGQNAAGIRYAFAYGFSTPSWQGEATLKDQPRGRARQRQEHPLVAHYIESDVPGQRLRAAGSPDGQRPPG